MNQTTLLILALVLLFLLSACSEDDLFPRASFELDSGEVVSCRAVEETSCGVDLWDCTTGVRYTCQTNVREL